MSGIDIGDGGAIAVDSASLRLASEGADAVATALGRARDDLGEQAARLLSLGLFDTALWRATSLAFDAGTVTDEALRLAGALRDAATVYEMVELRAELDMALAAGDAATASVLSGRLRGLVTASPALAIRAGALMLASRIDGPVQLGRQAYVVGPLGPSAVGAAALLVAAAGRGRVPAGSVLTGPRVPVTVSAVPGSVAVVAPPASLGAVVDRMPTGAAQVRVERYAMPDGTQRFAVYAGGTRPGGGPDEPWDGESNLQLYNGERSASYEATAQALRDAGAGPGDAVYAFGYSQGAMITGHLALEGGYDMKANVTFGEPASAEVGPDTLSVQVRHTDDPIAALATGGSVGQVGSDDSFVVERVADPWPTLDDPLGAHGLDAYRDTAASIDASTDPRTDALDAMFADLARAERVEASEYIATRVPEGVVTAARVSPRAVSDAG